MNNQKPITKIPINIITGFLGSGKTTTILNILKSKSANKKWAVLVNEFGEIGVDGNFLEQEHKEEQGFFIRQVAGGCVCCTSSMFMKTAINELLTKTRPDRLLIEPTGLGHPSGVLRILTNKDHQGLASIQKIITLVDARRLSDNRYTNHEVFNEQITIADIIVGNKSDLYEDKDKEALVRYVAKKCGPHVKTIITEQGQLELSYLDGQTNARDNPLHLQTTPLPFPESFFPKEDQKQSEEFQSIGWKFSSNQVFNREKLISFFQRVNAERIKGVLSTELGAFGYNISGDDVKEFKLDTLTEGCVEIIATKVENTWEEELTECILIH